MLSVYAQKFENLDYKQIYEKLEDQSHCHAVAFEMYLVMISHDQLARYIHSPTRFFKEGELISERKSLAKA